MNDAYDHNHFHQEMLPNIDELKHLRELLVKYEVMIMQKPPTPYAEDMVSASREIQEDLENRITKLSAKK